MHLCFRVSQQIVALEEWVCRAKLLVQRSRRSHMCRGFPLDWHQSWAVCREPISTGEHQMDPLSSSFGTDSPEGHCVCVGAVTFLLWIEAPVLTQPAAKSAHETAFPRQETKQLLHSTEHEDACSILLLEHLNCSSGFHTGIAWQKWPLQCFSGM